MWAAKLYRQVGDHRAADQARILLERFTTAPTSTRRTR
jgi:hypothetical protein